MRDLNQETWFLYTVTSIEHFERCAQACQDFAELFDQIMTQHDVHGHGKLDYWVKTYYGHAKDIRRLIELVKLGDYLPMSDELNDADTSYKGIIEKNLSWMTTEEEEKWNAAFMRLSNLCGISHEAMRNNEWAGDYWVNREEHKHEQELVDRDDSAIGDIEQWSNDLQEKDCLPKPDPYPQYFVDKSRSCRAGETCPWTGVWVPEQALSEGLEHFNLAFAVAGRPMQPAYRIVAWVKDETFSDPEYLASVGGESDDDPTFDPETKAEDALWYPVVQIEADAQATRTPATHGRLRALPNELVPKTGWWHTFALRGDEGTRYFEQGQRFPETRYGKNGDGVIWGYDPNQQKKPPQK